MTHTKPSDFASAFDVYGRLRKEISEELLKSIRLLESISDSRFTEKVNRAGSVGAHLRHNLNFIETFVNGLERGELDYSDRTREVEIETSRSAALGKVLELSRAIDDLDDSFPEAPIRVRSELFPDIVHISSIGRELEFLHSHTVHHYALITEILRSGDNELGFDFGVAPSTLRYWKTLDDEASQIKGEE
jgi:hypothetical protein